ncbi:MAG TPA: hypothetical protein VF786_12635 [Terriglobales bacterium]
MTAIHTLLTGFFDYAGLYPPASLSLRSAANNYLSYASGKHAWALGRFIINLDRLEELRSIAGDRMEQFKLSVILPDADSLAVISREINSGMPIKAIEMKSTDPETIHRIPKMIPETVNAYIEVPLDINGIAALQSISSAKMRAKIRMGGVTAEAFPPASKVVPMLSALAKLRLPFKATAGLHHPIRSHQPLTYDPHSTTSTMHGFLNLCCAAAILYFGGGEQDAEQVLQETDLAAWHADQESLQWRHLKWTDDQLATLRSRFFTSVGSCSFEEPTHDLEALGWL